MARWNARDIHAAGGCLVIVGIALFALGSAAFAWLGQATGWW